MGVFFVGSMNEMSIDINQFQREKFSIHCFFLVYLLFFSGPTNGAYFDILNTRFSFLASTQMNNLSVFLG